MGRSIISATKVVPRSRMHSPGLLCSPAPPATTPETNRLPRQPLDMTQRATAAVSLRLAPHDAWSHDPSVLDGGTPVASTETCGIITAPASIAPVDGTELAVGQDVGLPCLYRASESPRRLTDDGPAFSTPPPPQHLAPSRPLRTAKSKRSPRTRAAKKITSFGENSVPTPDGFALEPSVLFCTTEWIWEEGANRPGTGSRDQRLVTGCSPATLRSAAGAGRGNGGEDANATANTLSGGSNYEGTQRSEWVRGAMMDGGSLAKVRQLIMQNARNRTPAYSCHYPKKKEGEQDHEDEGRPSLLSSPRKLGKSSGRGKVHEATLLLLHAAPRPRTLRNKKSAPGRHTSKEATATTAAISAVAQSPGIMSYVAEKEGQSEAKPAGGGVGFRGGTASLSPLTVEGTTAVSNAGSGCGRFGEDTEPVFLAGRQCLAQQGLGWPTKSAGGSLARPPPRLDLEDASPLEVSPPLPCPSPSTPPRPSTTQSSTLQCSATIEGETGEAHLSRDFGILSCLSNASVQDLLLPCVSPAGDMSPVTAAAAKTSDLRRTNPKLFSTDQRAQTKRDQETSSDVAKAAATVVRCRPLASAGAVALGSLGGGDGAGGGARRRKKPPKAGRGGRPSLSPRPRIPATMNASVPPLNVVKDEGYFSAPAAAAGAATRGAVRDARRGMTQGGEDAARRAGATREVVEGQAPVGENGSIAEVGSGNGEDYSLGGFAASRCGGERDVVRADGVHRIRLQSVGCRRDGGWGGGVTAPELPVSPPC